MKSWLKLIAFAICLALVFPLASCADFGVGDSEDALKEYISGVYVVSKKGMEKYSIADFNEDIDMEDTEIPVIVPFEEYCYIGFEVAKCYTVSLSEFAFFARTASGSGVLELEFYVVDQMPTNLGQDGEGGEAEETSAGEGESAPEESEEELFDPDKKFHTSLFSVGEEWDSVLLEFDAVKTVEAGQYIVVRINNNCETPDDSEESTEGDQSEETPSVSFTFNYLLFYFTDAHKE